MRERKVVFVDGVRTGFGKMGGTLRDLPASTLAGKAIKGLLDKTGILERAGVDAVFAGSAMNDCQCYNAARYASLSAGLPYETSASFIEMQCGSAIDAINHAACKILCGCADIIIAGGMESHSQAVAKFSMAVPPYRQQSPTAIRQRGTPVDEDDISMIEINERMAQRWHISREASDEFALRSQQRADAAIAKGYFKEEIVPVVIPGGRKKPDIVFDYDEHVRPGTTLEGLAKLPPILQGGVTTAGSASGLNDGAAFVLMMTEEKARELGYKPYAAWVMGADYGVDPKYMGIGPAFSNMLALKRAGLRMEDIDVFECNEAFAAQNLSVIREMERQSGVRIDMEKWNPNGGAIAFGHPNGASGARVCMFAMRELERRGGRYGIFSSCCGGGLGVSTIIENLRY